ncbi:MAG: Unknown protein [uncultured Sulfurovum sp.]|uniref:Uncharacterized protein n=1 Tax=uncultured Sulfurovum sp. TaxID=269237 RepID=A0A6S6UL62_9BACT|nr:MAG: Unknown protein [uncultured Sulfurovum sp.]
MNIIEKIGSLNFQELSLFVGMVVGIFTLFLGVLTIYLQHRTQKKQFKLQTFYAYTQRYQDIIINLPIDIESDSYDITSKHQEENLRWFRAYFDLCSEEYFLSKEKLIDEHVWNLWKQGMQSSFNKPAFSNAWKQIPTNDYYCEEFQNFFFNLTSNK